MEALCADSLRLPASEASETVQHGIIQSFASDLLETRRPDAPDGGVRTDQFTRIDATRTCRCTHRRVHRAIHHQIRERQHAVGQKRTVRRAQEILSRADVIRRVHAEHALE